MDLVERYIFAVTRHLPSSQRKEVANDVRAMINDMATDRASKKPSAADYKAIIKELGNPEKLAREYERSSQYLISPRWYDTYIKLLKQLLVIVPPIIAIIAGLAHFADSKAVIDSIVAGIGAALEVAVHIAFWMTLTFAVFDRTGVKPDEVKSEWTIEDLPELPASRQISKVDTIAAIVLTAFAGGFVAVAASFPAWWSDLAHPTLNPALWQGWIQGLIALSLASIALEFAKYKIGNWTIPLAIFNVIIDALWATFIIAAVLTQEIINPGLLAEVQGKADSQDIKEAIEWTVNIAIVITVISCAWSAVESVYKAVAHRR